MVLTKRLLECPQIKCAKTAAADTPPRPALTQPASIATGAPLMVTNQLHAASSPTLREHDLAFG